ncbi:glycosyltransferase family 2 protein [Neobacillus sp. YIM B06451]|uniref:glycosyltransferase family 2 protein n=1 Tax=Neobacillus sp. YIM B06451 TaxID=3070994 RepID=UPI00292DC4E1|nr:glycosyltransferase family 2 protein [Neobacillus sp. YIM B06451]
MLHVKTPLVSIIIPVYNAQKFLQRCIDSVLNQTFKDFELILVNDGSNDSSGEICDLYCEQNERVQVHHIKNGGPSRARNHGMAQAKGKYITFIDADDYVNAFFSDTANKVKSEDYDLIVAPFSIVNPIGDSVESFQYIEKSFSSNERKQDFLKAIWLGKPLFGSCWNKWYKKSIICANGIGFMNDFFIAEDYLFNLHFYRKCQSAVLVSFPYYLHIQHENSVTSRIYYNRFDIAKTVYIESLKLLGDINIHDHHSRTFVEEAYLSGVLRAMFDIAKTENKLTFREKITELKKYLNDEEVRTLAANNKNYTFNRWAFFCLKYQLPMFYYSLFKIRNLLKG